MSRIASGDVVYVRPTNNVYTALAAAGFVLTLTGFILFYLKVSDILGPDNSLFAAP
ncbi:MAG TPA: hypothetical protein VGB55_16250 [Tepidisphaeraceae bacterium]|jgi:hypothetical protein